MEDQIKTPAAPFVIGGTAIALMGGAVGAYFHILEATLVGGISGGLSLAEHSQLALARAAPMAVGGLIFWGGIRARSGLRNGTDQDEFD